MRQVRDPGFILVLGVGLRRRTGNGVSEGMVLGGDRYEADGAPRLCWNKSKS